MRGAIRTAQKVGRRFRRANRLRRQNERARVLASPTESSVAIPEDQEEGGSRQGELPRSGKRGWSGPCAVFALAAETERSERLLTPPPCKHADSFALLLVLSKPKHRFGFVRRNGGADVELSGLPGKRNGASPFGRYPLLHSSLPGRRSSLRPGDAGYGWKRCRLCRGRCPHTPVSTLCQPSHIRSSYYDPTRPHPEFFHHRPH